MFFNQIVKKPYLSAIYWMLPLNAVAQETFEQAESSLTGSWGLTEWILLTIFILIIAAHWGLIFWLVKKGKKTTADIQTNMDEALERTRAQVQREIRRHDMTEGQLNKTKDYLHCLVNSLPTVVIGVSESGKVTHWNIAAESMTGIEGESTIGKPFSEVFKLFDVPLEYIKKTISQGTPYIQEREEVKSEAQSRFFDFTVHPLKSKETRGAVILVQDVTFRVRLENSMVQNEKMVSLGQMAAGLAHEINNPLSAMLSNVQNIGRRFAPGLPANAEVAESLGIDTLKLTEYVEKRKIPQLIDGVQQAGDRAAKIVKTMLHFSHAPTVEFEENDLEELIVESLDLATKTLELKAVDGLSMPFIIRDFDPSIPKVESSASEIQQVLLNLLINAAQAIHQQPGGNSNPTITVRLHVDGDRAIIELQDNGPGIKEEIKSQIFEPFFTTKEVGSGTGLGLSVSYFIVKEHHQGEINVFSKYGNGTRFVISLPIRQVKQEESEHPPRMLIHTRR